MFRLLFVFVLSLSLTSPAVAAVKWNNPNSSEIKLWNTSEQFSFVLPQDVYDKFREVPTQTAEQFCTSGSKAPVFRLEALIKASVPSKISGFNSRMDNTDNVIGARQAEKYVQELSEVVTSAWALEDKTRINLSLEALSYWAENNALLDTYSCINSDGKTKNNCEAWKRKDGQDRSKSMDWNTAQMHLNHIAYSYYFGLSHFLPGDERHQKIQRWLITSFERNKKPNDVFFGNDLGWNWPKILNEQLRGKSPKPLLNSIIKKLDKIVLSDGSLKDRTTRGNRALWYHNSALAEIYLTLEMARLHNVLIPKSLEKKLHKSVSIFLNGFANHSYMDKWAKEQFRSIYEPGHQIFHDTLDLPGYNSWFFIYMYRYPNNPLTKKLENHLQKLMDVGRRDNLIGFGFGCVYATLYSQRSSDDVVKNPTIENYNSQKIENNILSKFDFASGTQFKVSSSTYHIPNSEFLIIDEKELPQIRKSMSVGEQKKVMASFTVNVIGNGGSSSAKFLSPSISNFNSLISLMQHSSAEIKQTTSLGVTTGHLTFLAEDLAKTNELAMKQCGALPGKLSKRGAYEWIFVVTKTEDIRVVEQQNCVLNVFLSEQNHVSDFYKSLLILSTNLENYANAVQ